MKKLNLFIISSLLFLFNSCDTDVDRIQIQDGVAPVVESSSDENTIIPILEEDQANVVYNLDWTHANYLGENTDQSVVSAYQVEISSLVDFSDAVSLHANEIHLAYEFLGSQLNNILVNELGAIEEESIDIYFRIQSTFDEDVLVSNTISNTFIPYRLVPLPEVYLPVNETIFITGAAVGGPWPFPAKHKFTKVTETLYTLETYLIGGESYEMVADASWSQAYKIPADVVPADVATAGTFVEDGGMAHDEYGNVVERWEGQNFLSPIDDGTYTISLNFQTGTYTVEPGAKPAIYLPPNEEVYITGDAVGSPWPFNDDIKLTKESATVYSIVIDLPASTTYEFVTDQSWSQAYKLPANVVAADVTTAGTFVENGGKAHDETGNEIELWEGQNFLSPAEAVSYKLTLDFQSGTYTVEKQ